MSFKKEMGTFQLETMTEGCPRANDHPYCKEPLKMILYPIPKITMNKVKFTDMNFLIRKDALDILNKLGEKRVNKKVVYYEFTSGFDFRLLTPEIAIALRNNRIIRPRIAWDSGFEDQYNLKKP